MGSCSHTGIYTLFPLLISTAFVVVSRVGRLGVTGMEHVTSSVNVPKYYRYENWPRGYKTFFVLNSVEPGILNAHEYKNIKKFGIFNAQLSLECYFSRSYMLKCQQLLAF